MKIISRTVFAAAALLAIASRANAQTPEEYACMQGNPVDGAIRICTRLIESKQYSGKQLGVFFLQRGWLELRRDNYQRAISDMTNALNSGLDPFSEMHAKGYRCRTRALANVDLDAALRDCAEAIPPPTGMRNFRARIARGMVHLRLNRNQEALEDLNESKQNTPEVHYLRSVAYSRLGNKAGAESNLEAAIKKDKAVVDKLIALGFK